MPEPTADPEPVSTDGGSGLSDQDLRILELESRTFRYQGTKERAIREQIGISRIAYYVRLNRLLDDPEALRTAPALIHRLQARRTTGGDAAAHRDSGRVA